MAARTPPAAAMWLFLIRMASNRPMRWLVTPPAAAAIFSRRRRPGVVLRVSSTRQPVPATRFGEAARQRGDAAQPLQEVERHALAFEQRARAARAPWR